MPRLRIGDYVVSKIDIKYNQVFDEKNDIKRGDVGQIKEILKNVPIQAISVFCEDKDYTSDDLGSGYSTFLSIEWLTGPQKGRCLRTHKSNVAQISKKEASYLLKIKK